MLPSNNKIVISEFMDDEAVQWLDRQFSVLYNPTLVDNREGLQAAVHDAQVLIVRNRTRVDEALLAAAPGLRMVGRLGVGLDNIAMQACQQRGIHVVPATGANAQAVAEYVIASALVLWRGCFFESAAVAQGAWPRERLTAGREISGHCLGLVGFGGIGRLVAGMASALGVDVIAHDPYIPSQDAAWANHQTQAVTLDELLQRADIISVHIPLLPESRHLFNASLIAKMKPGSVLINTSRGGIVDEVAVAEAVASGHLSGAALDVFNAEPLPDSPHLNVPGLLLTPHIAGVTQQSNKRVSQLIAHRVSQFLGGQ